MGGQIDVESEPGKGSVFRFTARFGQSRLALPSKPRPLGLNIAGKRVLVVDDNATNRQVLKEMTASWGLIPQEAASAEEALAVLSSAWIRGQGFDLMLLDCSMPRASGFALAHEIKRHPVYGTLKIIMLTSMGEKGDVARCKELGISGYLLKPVRHSELLEAVTMALGSAQEAEEPIITRHLIRDAKRRLKVLLAEDNPVNQKLAVRLLEKRGHRVCAVTNGKEVLASIEREMFDLILMDVQMPEMDGLEASRRIREKESATGGHIPIIALTAHALKGDREMCLEAGMDDYVSKPLKPDELFAAIERFAVA